MIEKVISGGQTGVDRAALDVAAELGLPRGGWCPNGRRAEDGPIPERYPLTETTTARYPQRTAANVRAGDGTLILTRGAPDRGTALTERLARRAKKPLLVIDLDRAPPPETVRAWAEENAVRVLNVAGLRESSRPGIYRRAAEFLRGVLG